MTTLLALDLGSLCGFALAGSDGTFMSGQWDMRPKRHATMGARASELRKTLGKLHAATPVNEVWYEAVDFHTTTYSAQLYGSLLATVQEFAEERNLPCTGVSVGTLKKYATGKGNAGKPAMIAAAKRMGYDFPDKNDNEADALCLLHYAISEGLFK